MIWFAIRRGGEALPTFCTAGCGENRLRSSRLPRDQLGTVGGVSDRPPQLGQPIPQLVGASEVLRRPRLLAFLHQLPSIVVGLSTLIWLSKGAEADQFQHLRNGLSRLSPIYLTAIGFPHQLEHLRERPGRVEVISERILERRESCTSSGSGAGGGVPRHSPAFVWGPLPRRP